MKSFKQIGMEEGTSISTVLRIFNDIRIPEKEFDYETVYFDEFKGNAGKEKYQLAIYDKKEPWTDWYSEGQEDINDKRIPSASFEGDKEGKHRHVHAVQEYDTTYFPDADIVADKYHVIRQGNWMIRDVRIRLFNSIRTIRSTGSW